jgi:glycosyltransferase involved in cell wall biosynthesis
VTHSFAEARTPRTQHRDRSVAILLCTKDGAAFIDEQLRSLADQTHSKWILIASDDGSTDTTRDVLERFAGSVPQKVVIREGPGRGSCANFLWLAIDRSIKADYFAYSDQDDVWYPDKLERALDWLVTVSQDTPALYCGRTEIALVDGRPNGFSPRFSRPPSFRNALIQNIAGGNTELVSEICTGR